MILPQALQEFDRLRSQGVKLVFATASARLWLLPLLKKAKIDHEDFVGTQLVWKFGGLTVRGKNCLGAQKLVELEKIFPGLIVGKQHCLVGYSDSYADLPMLKLCESQKLISPTPSHLNKYSGQLRTFEVLKWRG
jgi:phosphatidylglycerophosphatase C